MRNSTTDKWLIPLVHSWEDRYSPAIGLYRTPFQSPGYHTSIKQAEFVHPLRENAIYALALLDSALPELRERAYSILNRIALMQDRDPTSETCGIWPWFYEEPLDRMEAPDRNWADFIGKTLVLTLIRHGSNLPDALRQQLRSAVRIAIESIIQRDVGPHYTNISIMGAFVTLVGGECLGIEQYAEYGQRRLERLLAYTEYLGTFQEYNSPTYAKVAILELSKIVKETKRERAASAAKALLHVAWKMVAAHYHTPTREWSGPHSRSYSTLLRRDVRSFLQYATNGAVAYMPWEQLDYSPEWVDSGLACPSEWLSRFKQDETRTVQDTVFINPQSEFRKIAVTYLTSDYTLGSFNQTSMWNQCRGLVAYADNRGKPVYMHVRFLNNGYDFCSAMLNCNQYEGSVLFGIHWIADGGNTHPNLDPTVGTIVTSDLRIRFEFGGELTGVQFSNRNEQGMDVRLGNRTVAIRLLHGKFSEASSPIGEWQAHESDDKQNLDLVLYSGMERKFHLKKIRELAYVFALSFQDPSPGERIAIRQADRQITAEGTIAGHSVSIVMPDYPVVTTE